LVWIKRQAVSLSNGSPPGLIYLVVFGPADERQPYTRRFRHAALISNLTGRETRATPDAPRSHPE